LDQRASWTTRGYTGVRLNPVDYFRVETYPTTKGSLYFYQTPNDQVRSYYRPDLHDELKRIALLQSQDWKTPSLRLGSEVESVVRATSYTCPFLRQ
jgi:hypothetical protein